MSKVVQFPIRPPAKLGHKKARKSRKPDLEALGQLNLFTGTDKEAPIVSLTKKQSYFEQALEQESRDIALAEKYYLLAIQLQESAPDAYCNLGILKANQEHLSEAIDNLTKCLEVQPRHFEAHYNLANVYADLGNTDLAKAHYEIAIKLEPDYPNSYYNLALVFTTKKMFREAIDHINRYVSLTPGSDHYTAHELIKTINAIAQ